MSLRGNARSYALIVCTTYAYQADSNEIDQKKELNILNQDSFCINN